MKTINLNDKEVARLERKLAKPGVPGDEAAFVRFLIRKYKASKARSTHTKLLKPRHDWAFNWSYKF
jgi:hypothetical protein